MRAPSACSAGLYSNSGCISLMIQQGIQTSSPLPIICAFFLACHDIFTFSSFRLYDQRRHKRERAEREKLTRRKAEAVGSGGCRLGESSFYSEWGCVELRQQNCSPWGEGTRRDPIASPGCRGCFPLPRSLHGMVLAQPQRRWDCPCGVMVLPLSPIPMGYAPRNAPMGLSCWEVALKLGQLSCCSTPQLLPWEARSSALGNSGCLKSPSCQKRFGDGPSSGCDGQGCA